MRALRTMLVLTATLLAPSLARATIADLPDLPRSAVETMVGHCVAAGGRPGNAAMAIERIDLDGDGTPDVILDENRLECRDRPFAHCQEFGCQTSIFLSHRGSWKPSLIVTGSYCIEYGRSPPSFVTIQRNFNIDGAMQIVNVRYRFRRGLYFQDGRGVC